MAQLLVDDIIFVNNLPHAHPSAAEKSSISGLGSMSESCVGGIFGSLIEFPFISIGNNQFE